MSVDPRRTQPFCTPRCYRECRCSRWPGYLNRFGWPVRPVTEQEYYEKVLSYGPIAYWWLGEQTGTVAHCLVNPLQNGTYNSPVQGWPPGEGIGDGYTAPYFDGANDCINVLTATLIASFPGNVGTLAMWMRVLNVGVWTDGAPRYGAAFVDATDFNEQVSPWKDAVNNRFWYTYRSGGVTSQVVQNGIATTDWYHVAITWSNVANQVVAYYNGAQFGAPVGGLGVWAGNITRAVIGAPNTTPTLAWRGWLAHCALWNTVLPPATIADLATV